MFNGVKFYLKLSGQAVGSIAGGMKRLGLAWRLFIYSVAELLLSRIPFRFCQNSDSVFGGQFVQGSLAPFVILRQRPFIGLQSGSLAWLYRGDCRGDSLRTHDREDAGPTVAETQKPIQYRWAGAA